jgi:hypothetical protein
VRSNSGDSAIEALFQENLMIDALFQQLKLRPVDREYPVWRGLIGAVEGKAPRKPRKRRGSIDFLGLDQDGRLHIVETKVSASDVAILMQCLDYFQWVTALGAELIEAEEEEWGHGDASKDVVIDIICAPKPGADNVVPTGAAAMGPYFRSQTELIASDIDLRVYFAEDPLAGSGSLLLDGPHVRPLPEHQLIASSIAGDPSQNPDSR